MLLTDYSVGLRQFGQNLNVLDQQGTHLPHILATAAGFREDSIVI